MLKCCMFHYLFKFMEMQVNDINNPKLLYPDSFETIIEKDYCEING